MIVKKIVVGVLETNCYVVSKDDECLVIDPGDEFKKIDKAIENLKVRGILLTHSHPDHVQATKAIREKYNCDVYVHEIEAKFLDFKIGVKFLEEGLLTCGNFNLQIFHTPGHTPGSICILIDKKLFCGDTLFCGSVGRTDLPGGDMGQLINSVNRISKLEKDIKIYPGHGPISTIGAEIEHNPYIKAWSLSDSKKVG